MHLVNTAVLKGRGYLILQNEKIEFKVLCPPVHWLLLVKTEFIFL